MAGPDPAKPKPKEPGDAAPRTPPVPVTWGDIWHLPALALGLVLLIGGGLLAVSKRPKPDYAGAFVGVEALIEAREYENALSALNKNLLPYLDKPALGAEDRRRFHTLVARTIYLWQQEASVKRVENYRTVAAEYAEARKGGTPLKPPDSVYALDARIEVGELEESLEAIRELGVVDRGVRYPLLRKLVDKVVTSGRASGPITAELLAGMLAEPELPRDMRVWATARQADAMLAAGAPDEAIARLLKDLPRLAAARTDDLGEIYLALGEAYLSTNALIEASKQLARASECLDPASVEMGRTQLLLARVSDLSKNPDDAKERYEWITEHLAGTVPATAAKLGLAELSADADETDRAVELFTEVVRAVKSGEGGELTPERVAESLSRLVDENDHRGDAMSALRYVTLAEALYGPDDIPTPLLKRLGTVNRKMAMDSATAGRAGEADEGALARQYYLSAARYFSLHATRLALDPGKEHADSVWAAADCADRAGDRETAMTAFREFQEAFPTDPRQPEASFRLARAHQARGELPDAAAQFLSLIHNPNAGRYADDSYVPLAQTYLLDNDDSNDDRAMELLNTAVSGALGGPNTENFREALIALGGLLYDKARSAQARLDKAGGVAGADPADLYAQAIGKLSEALERFPPDRRSDAARFKLADACRLSARVIDAALSEAMPDAQKREMQQRRAQRLLRAQTEFENVRRALDARDPKHRSANEDLMLRNATLYAADCAFDLGDFESAIRKYDAAQEKYSTDPASLVALVQIVNAYMKLGDTTRAAAANEHARRYYAALPATAWNDPNLPMSRRDWERWLDATDELTRLRQADAQGRTGE